jgi:hypothetical protein
MFFLKFEITNLVILSLGLSPPWQYENLKISFLHIVHRFHQYDNFLTQSQFS